MSTQLMFHRWTFSVSLASLFRLLSNATIRPCNQHNCCCVMLDNQWMQGCRSLWDRGDMSPQYLWRGMSMVMSPPPNILEVMSFRLGLFYPVTATTVVCCIFYANIMCSFTKSFSFWGTPSPRPSVFFYVPSKKSCEIDTLECTERGQS